MRQYIRHPTDIPIHIEKVVGAMESADKCEEDTNLQNISHGGLCCMTHQPFAVGEKVKASISVVQPKFDIYSEVMWCYQQPSSYEVGIRFLNAEDAFAVRMVQQVCHIELYKREVYLNEGRTLTSEEAAVEWIGKYASRFPVGH